jgi:pSer/pThr/pTyr-binding forkhead associated (FHA) protein
MSQDRTAGTVRITPEDIITLILDEMQAATAPSLYSNLVPNVFDIYMYADDLDRLRPLIGRIRDEATRALSSRITELNKSGLKLPLLRDRTPRKQYEALGDWALEFHENTDDDAADNALVVVSSFPREAETTERAGTMTERVTKRRLDGNISTIETMRTADLDTKRATGILCAQISYEDQTGAHTYLMTRDTVKVGRGAIDRWVDLKLGSQKDISREHLQIRRDPNSGKFFIKDLSSLGTTVNGKRIPGSIEKVNGEDVDRNIEIPLPDKARIGLAGVLNLEFRAVR